MTRVLRGSRGLSVSLMSEPSTLETKWSCGPSWKGASAPCRHRRPEVGTADTDIDDIAEGFAGGTRNTPVPKVHGEAQHAFTHRQDLGHDISAGSSDVVVTGASQRHMECGAAFREIDRFSPEHLFALGFDSGGSRQGKEARHGPRVELFLGVVDKDVVEAN